MSGGRRIASDIGGTFTDIAYLDGQGRLATGKLPSTPADFADGVVAGLVELLERLEIDVGAIDEVRQIPCSSFYFIVYCSYRLSEASHVIPIGSRYDK